MISIASPAQPARKGHGRWGWLLRTVGQLWFRADAAATSTDCEERVVLLLTLPEDNQLLAKLLRQCAPAIKASGSELVGQLATGLLLAWPADLGEQQALPLFMQLRASLYCLAPQAQLRGAASVGWVKLRSAGTDGQSYQGEVMRQVVGILHESTQLGGGLLISAALHHRLNRAVPFQYQLHVAFQVKGHRYPATLYQVAAEKVG
jgi:hypothetical protein